MSMTEKQEEWRPPWKVHLPVWLGAVIAGGLVFREIAWWAGILVFVGIMTVYGLVMQAIRDQQAKADA